MIWDFLDDMCEEKGCDSLTESDALAYAKENRNGSDILNEANVKAELNAWRGFHGIQDKQQSRLTD